MSSFAERSKLLAHDAIEKEIPIYRLTDNEVPAEEARQVTVAAQKRILEVGGCTRKEIGVILRRTILAMMVERGELSIEHAELLAVLEKQYPQMVATLERYELISHGDNAAKYGKASESLMPTWPQIKNALNAEVLDRACNLEEPVLVIVPPVSRLVMVEAIDAHEVKGQTNNTSTYHLESDDLWNGGGESKKLPWEVVIVTGVQDVTDDSSIQGTNYYKAKAWVKKYADRGIDVINDVRTYLMFMMRTLALGKPIDKEFWTILNAKNLTEQSFVSFGCWDVGRVDLNGVSPGKDSEYLRLRGLVNVL